MKAKFMTIAMMMAVLGTVSCSKDLYDENKAEEYKQAQEAAKQANLIDQYKANFEKKYGKIDANQSWDFSTLDYSFFTSSSEAATRAPGGPGAGGPAGPAADKVVSKMNSWYVLPDATLGLMNTVFLEGHDNTQNFMEGTFFELNVPENDFYILPIYMGQSGGNFRLYLSVNTGKDPKGNDKYTDYPLWNKWDDLQYKLDNDRNWRDVRIDNRNGYNTKDAVAIQSKPIKVSVKDLPKGAKMHFYLKITEKASIYNHKDDKLGCLNGYIKEYLFNAGEVNLTSLPGIDNNSTDPIQCKFFGCEDASTSNSDKDFNDVVFLCYGQPKVPQSTKITEYTRENRKRYMIEDLGAADDRDFNDIVVDIVETEVATVETYDDGTPLSGFENPNYVKTGTRAEIRALGGTLDFELTIGSTTWRKSENMPENWTQMVNTYNPSNDLEPLFTYPVEGYDIESNNVSVKVFQEDGEKVASKVAFPQNGSVPMMIATNSDQVWAVERSEFPFNEYLNPVEDSEE
jgi:hypothetical protein